MPGRNQKGPMGLGPMTGRGAGNCNGAFSESIGRPGPGLGFGAGFRRGQNFQRGRGYGRGYGNRMSTGMAPPFFDRGATDSFGHMSPYTEQNFLQNQAAFLKEQLSRINQRIKELAGKSPEKGNTEPD